MAFGQLRHRARAWVSFAIDLAFPESIWVRTSNPIWCPCVT